MSGKRLLLVVMMCVAMILFILAAIASVYIAASYRWLLIPLGVWLAAMVFYRMKKER